MRQPSDGVPSRQPGGPTSARQFTRDLPERHPNAAGPGGFGDRDRGGFGDRGGSAATAPRRPRRAIPPGAGEAARGREAFPVRQPTVRPPRTTSGGRHRRAVPASLPQSAPALVLAVPGSDTDLTSGAGRGTDGRAPGGQPGGGGAGRAHRRRRARRPVRPAGGAGRRGEPTTRRHPVRRRDPADRDGQPPGDTQAARVGGRQRGERHRQRVPQLERDDRRGAAHPARGSRPCPGRPGAPVQHRHRRRRRPHRDRGRPERRPRRPT